MDMSIICSCLPTLPSLFRYWRDTTKSDGSSNEIGTARANRLLSSRKDKSRGYADLESDRMSYESSSAQDFNISIKSAADNEIYDIAHLDQVHVQREFEVKY